MVDRSALVQKQRSKSKRQDWQALARSLLPLIEAEIPVSEKNRTLSPEVVGALKETELFWMMVPAEIGGGGCSFRDLIEVIEELSWADCSAGWSFMANVESIGAAGAYCGDSAIEAMFGGKERAIVAGMLGPGGTCLQVKAGYQARGKFSYGSGCAHANWLGGGMFVLDDGKIRQLRHGPEVRICFVPREAVNVLDNWNVAGLSATGSFDYEISEQFVGDDFTMERAMPVQRRGAPYFQLGFAPIVGAGHAAVVLGGMKRALEEIARIAHEKKRAGYSTVVGDYPVFMYEFGIQEANYMAARDYVIKVFDEAEAAVSAGFPISDYQRARFRQVPSWVHKIAADVIRFCYVWSGAEGFRGSTPIGRAFRDMYVATNHLFLDPVTITDSAPAVLEHYRRRGEIAPKT
jgi:alkylation response protein AidB-like acyl-CoA dehydrogenase